MVSPHSQFIGQNWLIVPATPLLPPADSGNQIWLLTLTGVFIAGSGGTDIGQGWRSRTFAIVPDFVSPLNFALNLYGIPHPPSPMVPFFFPDSTAPYANVGGVFDASGVGAGLGFKLESLETIAEPAFSGVNVTVWTQNLDEINRIGYNFTLRGKIGFIQE